MPPRGPLVGYQWASFFPDGRRILVVGHAEGRPLRLYVQNLSGGLPSPFSPEGLSVAEPSSPVSPDGKWVAAIREDSGGPPVLVPVGGGDVRPQLRPLDPAGAYINSEPLLVGDGEAYFCGVTRRLENPYLVQGLR